MERLISNKKVSDMSMIELAHNSCYVDNKRNARYRDYNLDIDSRELVRNLVKDICDEDLTDLSDEEFDKYMSSMLSVGIDSTMGLLALFYRNLWAMSDLREKLKEYEDLEEQERLVKLHCKIGDTIWHIEKDNKLSELIVDHIDINDNYIYYFVDERITGLPFIVSDDEFSQTAFLTEFEAEAKLKESRANKDE